MHPCYFKVCDYLKLGILFSVVLSMFTDQVFSLSPNACFSDDLELRILPSWTSNIWPQCTLFLSTLWQATLKLITCHQVCCWNIGKLPGKLKKRIFFPGFYSLAFNVRLLVLICAIFFTSASDVGVVGYAPSAPYSKISFAAIPPFFWTS